MVELCERVDGRHLILSLTSDTMSQKNTGSTPSRRHFLKSAAAGAAVAAVATPAWAHSSEQKGIALTDLANISRNRIATDEDFWHLVKQQFPLAPNFTLMNAANLCPSPYAVQETVFQYTRDIDQDASFQNRAKFSQLGVKSREALGRLLGASSDEIAITRNTSESNNTVINGLDLREGDEVILWDQNHPTNNVAWEVRAERWGYKVIHVSTPPAPETADELVAPFEQAITNRTRVLAFTHVSNISGVQLPAKRLCSIARERGIHAHVDGAQSFGAINIDLHAMGCDSYTGSAHKWFCGPKEAGVLYIRADLVDELWPSIVAPGWEGALASGTASKFDNYGQRDDAAVAAVGKTVEFHEAIGPAAVEARIRALATALKKELRTRLPGARFHTSDVPGRSCGVVIVNPGSDTDDYSDAYERLYTKHGISCNLFRTGAAFPGFRLCPHVYNTMEEMGQVADALAAEV